MQLLVLSPSHIETVGNRARGQRNGIELEFNGSEGNFYFLWHIWNEYYLAGSNLIQKVASVPARVAMHYLLQYSLIISKKSS